MQKESEGTHKKLIFLDIDGTISDIMGIMPESAKLAIRRARENGHGVCICTGRGKGELYPWLLKMDFDGYICGAGGYVEWKQNVVYANYMSTELLEKMGTLLVDRGIFTVFEGTACNYVHIDQKEMNDEFMNGMKALVKDQDRMILPDPVVVSDWKEMQQVNKCCYRSRIYDKPGVDKLLAEGLDDGCGKMSVVEYRWNVDESKAGEISLQGVHKAHGMELLLQYLHMNREDTIALGDSMNDYEMLQFAGTGVAMGNAQEELKQVADLVTSDIHEDGLYRAFEKLQLI